MTKCLYIFSLTCLLLISILTATSQAQTPPGESRIVQKDDWLSEAVFSSD